MDLSLGIAPPSLTGGIKENDTFGNLNEINHILGDMSSQASRTMVIKPRKNCEQIKLGNESK